MDALTAIMNSWPTLYDEKARTWQGPKSESVYNPNCSIGRVIFHTMKTWPSNVCQVSDIDDAILTNSEALTLAIRIAQHLKAKGLNHESVIGIVAKNSDLLLPIGIACLLNATPFHAINTGLDRGALKHVLGITKPALIFCDGVMHEKIVEATTEWSPEIYTTTEPIDGVAKVQDLLEPTKTERFYAPQPLTLGGDQTVGILCSSGTTGLPKSVCLKNKFFLLENSLINNEMIVYSNSSLDWVSGVLAFLYGTILGCTRVISNKPFTAENFIELVKKYEINFAVLAPRHIVELVQCPEATPENLQSIKFILISGGQIAQETRNRFQAVTTAWIMNGYGMTESSTIAVNLGLNDVKCVGKLMAGVRVRIVDDDGKHLGCNESGEIWVQTENSFNNYYGDPKETQRTRDSDGWIHTGDIGYFDEKNFLRVIDRKKDTLIYTGIHVWPTEIEHVIAELPAVAEVCVVGVYDESCGDRAGALVVKKKGAELSESQVEEHVRQRTEVEHKRLHAGVHFVDQIPFNHNGKIMRAAAKELFLKQN